MLPGLFYSASLMVKVVTQLVTQSVKTSNGLQAKACNPLIFMVRLEEFESPAF